MSKFTSLLHKVGFWTRKKSPELLVAGAIIAAAGSIVLAIKATPKAELILKKANKDIKFVKQISKENGYTEDAIAGKGSTLTKVYAKTAFDLGKLYLPTAIGFSLTVAGILGSHKIMKGRNVALAAAYTTLQNGYGAYRARVANVVGEKAEKDIFMNIYEEDKEVVVDKDGVEVVRTEKVKGPHIRVDSDFTVIWDRNAREWHRDTDMNLNLLWLKQKWLNSRLQHAGSLFLYEVYQELGIDVSVLGEAKLQASRVLGWIYDPTDPSRDSYITLGLFDQMGNQNEYAMDCLRNNAQELFLEFNVDGDILTGNNGKKTFMKNRKVI